MRCPVRGWRFGWVLPVVAFVAVTGFFVPVRHAVDPVAEVERVVPLGTPDASPAVPALSAPASAMVGAAGPLRPGSSRVPVLDTFRPASGRSPATRLPHQADGGRSRTGRSTPERLAFAGRWMAPSTAPPASPHTGA